MSTDPPVDDMAAIKAEAEKMGWYEWAGGLRYHDGVDWTDHFAPPPQPKEKTLGLGEMIMAAAIGAFLALALVWLLAQAQPDNFYFPVKFVVDDLPKGLNP